MKKRAGFLRSAMLHAKDGSGALLMLFDVFLVALLTFDIVRVGSLDLNYVSVLTASRLLDGLDTLSFVDFLVLLLAPILLALIGNFTLFRVAPELYYRYTTGAAVKRWGLLVHLIVAIACLVHTGYAVGLEVASGFCGPLDNGYYCFKSGFSFLERHRLLLVLGTLAPLVSTIARDSLYRGRELVKDFDFWRLLGAAGEYQPAYGDEIIYVNSASMAPSIKSVNAATSAYHHQYQKLVPTSDEAKLFLKGRAEIARALLQNYLLEGDARQKDRLGIEFFPGTSRALEAGILRDGDISHVLLSQYEHPSQVDVVRWLCGTHKGITFTPIVPASPGVFQEQWDVQKRKLIDSIKREIREEKKGKIAIVLSEVHYITGIHLRVDEVMRELREAYSKLVFIIDGSQAVGNLAKPLIGFASELSADDLYYFSAHKWLLSPNTCGVLISQRGSPRVEAYDVFGPELPTSTIDPNTILGLTSALQFLFDKRGLFDRLSEFSRVSRKYFEVLVASEGAGMELVQSATEQVNGSLFCAVRPRRGYRWRKKLGGFWEAMRGRGVDLTVIPVVSPYFGGEEEVDQREVSNYLVRISFPYFLIGRNVRNLVRYMQSLIEQANP